MRKLVLAAAWILWGHEMAVVGGKTVDRGQTAIDAFETRQECHAAMADYVGLKLVHRGRIKIDFTCVPDTADPKGQEPAAG